MPDVHAKLSASGAHRWMHCTPSVLLEQEITAGKEEETSSFAEEGTAAHELAEIKLRLSVEPQSRKLKGRLKKARESEYYNSEMEEATDLYVNHVIEAYNEAKAFSDSGDAVLLIEERLDFSPWVPDGFGTGDALIIADSTIDVIDLKYGKGIKVSAEANPQMRLYALGALHTYGALYDIDTVGMTIFQPRLDHVSTDAMDAKALLAWAQITVKPLAEMADKGEGEYVPGDHCRWCAARFTCRARAQKNLEVAAYEFRDPPELSQEEIADILSKAVDLQSWVSDVQSYALEQAERHGVKFPGWKLVEGRSTRKYSDEQAIEETLIAMGYKSEEIFNMKLKGITDMTKLLGKKTTENLIGQYIVKPAGKPTLVPESDKRKELSSAASAAEDFT